MGPAVSVIIATRDRCVLLGRMLRSLDECLQRSDVATQVVIADNGSTDATAQVVTDWIAGAPGRTGVYAPEPGKARALNRALGEAQAPLLVFTDDDVQLHPDWLRQVVRFASEHPDYVAGIGRVLLPPDVQDPDLRAQVAYFRTIPLFDSGDAPHDETHLYGANMFVRRSAFERVGPFNERLGPGASGLHEDGELARRLMRAGMRLGYMPEAMVYHVVEPERLTFAYFRTLQLRDARSRFAMDPHGNWLHSAAHWLGGAAVWALWALLANPGRRLRARGRMISYAELMRLRWQARRAGRVS